MEQLRPWLFRIVASVVLPIVLFATLEAALRVLGVGRPTAFTLAGELAGEAVRRQNPAFSEQFFPAAIARGPLVLSFPETKRDDTYRIFVLGGSAAQGDPEPTFGFSRFLEVMLEERYPGTRFEVINTAVTAINSHVVRVIAREIADYEPDLFVLYLGNNEVVGPFGAGTVFAPLSPNLAFIRFMVALESSRIFQVLSSAADRFGPRRDDLERWRGMEMFLERRVRADDPRLRDVYRHFRANLEDILDLASKAGARAIVSTVATHLRDSPPFASERSETLGESERAKWEAAFREGLALHDAGRHLEARTRLAEAASIDPDHAGTWFLLARCLLALGETEASLDRFRRARDLDALRFRADSRINDVIREVAAGRAAEGVLLVDAERVFEERSEGGVPGELQFHDHVHMTTEGNHLLAAAVLERIERLAADSPDRLSTGGGNDSSTSPGTRAAPLDLAESRRRLAFSEFDRHGIEQEMLQRLQRPPFVDQLGHAGRLERVRQRERRLRFTSRSARGIADATASYERALARRNADPWLHYNFGMFLSATGRFERSLAHLRETLAALPHHPVARERLLANLVRAGKLDEALAEARGALQLDPGFAPARYTMASIHTRRGDLDEAIETYHALLDDDPGRAADIYNEIGQLQVRRRRYPEAAAAFEHALMVGRGTDAEARPDIVYNLAVAAKRAGRAAHASRAIDEAIDGFRGRLESAPDSARLHFGLGNALVEAGDVQLAEASFRRAAELEPTDLQAHMQWARSLVAQGRTEEARSVLAAGSERLARMGHPDSAAELQRFRAALRTLDSGASSGGSR